jgi:hypothetical protein
MLNVLWPQPVPHREHSITQTTKATQHQKRAWALMFKYPPFLSHFNQNHK